MIPTLPFNPAAVIYATSDKFGLPVNINNMSMNAAIEKAAIGNIPNNIVPKIFETSRVTKKSHSLNLENIKKKYFGQFPTDNYIIEDEILDIIEQNWYKIYKLNSFLLSLQDISKNPLINYDPE